MKDIGRYIIKQQLGEGGMAKVFLAEDPVIKRKVAVKWIHPNLGTDKSVLARFTQEVQTAAALKSSHIVEIYDYGVVDKRQYFIMEYLDGYSLEYVLQDFKRRGSRLSPEIAVVLINQVALGLAVAAKHGVVHRDIKPDNLMIDSSGVVKIMDFGVALIEESDHQMGKAFGTPMYMAPEQFDGLPVTPQTDIWALGINLYYMLTGTLPFQGNNFQEVLKSVCTTTPPPVNENAPKVDGELAQLVEMLLQKNPHDRGQGAQWLCDWFENYLSQKRVYNLEKMTLKLLYALKPKPKLEASASLNTASTTSSTSVSPSQESNVAHENKGSGISRLIQKVFSKRSGSVKKTSAEKSLGIFKMSATLSKVFMPHAITISPENMTLRKGQSGEIQYHLPSVLKKGELTWNSSDTSIAVVNQGSVFGIKPGKTKIILNSKGETPGRAVCYVTVLPVAVSHVVMYPAKISLKVGKTTPLNPRVEPAGAIPKLSWRVDNPKIASVNQGKVKGLRPGYAKVTAISTDDNSKMASCEVHVKK